MQTQILPIETRVVRALLVYFCIGASIAAATQLAALPELVVFISKNTMPTSMRSRMLGSMAGMGLVAALVPAVLLLWRRSAAMLDAVTRSAGVLAPLMMCFVVPLLFDWRVFAKAEWLCVLAILLFGFGLERSLRISLASIDWTETRFVWRRLNRSPRFRALPLILTCTAAGLSALYFGYYTILQHYRVQTTSWDLAIFDNMMWNLIRGKWFKASPDLGRTGSHIQYHATFIAYVFAPLYALSQRSETLLALQALFTSAAALPIYLFSKARSGSAWLGLVFAYAYLVYAPMHGPLFYDFHFLTTAPFWIGWVLYFYEIENKRALVLTWLLAIMVREEVSAGLSMVAFFHLVSGKRVRWALVGGLVSACYFVMMKFYVMPLHRTLSGVQSFTWMYEKLMPAGEAGFGGVLRTVGSNPLFVFSSLLDIDKLTYILKILGPVLVLPLRHPATWIMLLPASIFTLLSSGYKPLYQTYFQYTSNFTSYLFFASVVTLTWWNRRDRLSPGPNRYRVPAAALAILVTSTLYSYQFGAIFQHNSFRGGFRTIQFHRTDAEAKQYEDLHAMIGLIPPDASVAATEAEAPHLSNREDLFTFRFGHDNAEYLLINIDEARSGSAADVARKALGSGKYGFVTQRGRLTLWKRGGDPQNNRKGMQLLHLPTKMAEPAAPPGAPRAAPAPAPAQAPVPAGGP